MAVGREDYEERKLRKKERYKEKVKLAEGEAIKKREEAQEIMDGYYPYGTAYIGRASQ
jgi:hypothetical protein